MDEPTSSLTLREANRLISLIAELKSAGVSVNIVNLQCIDSSLEFVVMGGVIMIAVSLDQFLAVRRRAREARIDVKAAAPEPAPATKSS